MKKITNQNYSLQAAKVLCGRISPDIIYAIEYFAV